jgi:flagellar hook-basal body protein
MSTTSIAITGMNAAQASINQASNNIANSETPGFKAGLMSLSNIPGGNGVNILAGNAVSLKGSLNYTGIVTDLATSDNKSFFIVENKVNNDVVNMVTGSFRPNQDGELECLGKYLLLGAKYADDGSLPGLDLNTLQPIVINSNTISNAAPTKNVTENFNLNSGLLAKGQASFVMTPNALNVGTTRSLSTPLIAGGPLQTGNGFLIQVQSEQNGDIETQSVKCIYTTAVTSNNYTSTANTIGNGVTTDNITIEYKGQPAVSITRGTLGGTTDSATLQNIANRINSIIGVDKAFVSTSGVLSKLVIKPPTDESDSLFISGTLAGSLGITTQILPMPQGSIRFSSMQDLKDSLSSYFSAIDSDNTSDSLLFIANQNTNVSMANLDVTKDVLGTLGMYEGAILGQGYDPYNASTNMASGSVKPDIVDAVTLYDSKGGAHIANIALKKVEDGWIQEVYMSNSYQIYGIRPDGLVQVTKFTFDSIGKLNTSSPVIPNATTSPVSDAYASILPSSGIGQFTLNGVTLTQGTDFESMIDLVNTINSNTTLQSDFEATIIKTPSGFYNLTVIAKGSMQPQINTNLFTVTNQASLPDASSALAIKFNPAENLQPLNLTFNWSNITESVYKDMFGSITADGMAPSTLASFAIDNTGDLIGTFANGINQKLYKIPLATYANVNGLNVLGDNTLRASGVSGVMQIQKAGSDSTSEVLSGNIELSNIDQAEELTKLIVYKQFYNMSTKSLQTGNAIIDYLLNSSGF